MRTHLYGANRLSSSVNGNPRYKIFTTDGPFITSSDTSASYEVDNAMNMDVTLELTRAGRVRRIHIEPFAQEELSVCVVCAHIIANGKFDDGTNATDLAISRTLLRYREGYTGMSVTGDEPSFSTTPCDTCGEELHGDRFDVTRLTAQ